MSADKLEGFDDGEDSPVKLGSQREEQNEPGQLPNVTCPGR